MSHVRLLSVDVAQVPENKGVSTGVSTSDQEKSRAFSDVIDEHYQEQKSGNDTPKSGKNSTVAENKSSELSTADEQDHAQQVDASKHNTETFDRDVDEVQIEQGDEDIIKLPAESLAKDTTRTPVDSLPVSSPTSMEVKQVGDKNNVADQDAQDLLTMLGAAKKILAANDSAGKVALDASEQVTQKNALKSELNAVDNQLQKEHAVANKMTLTVDKTIAVAGKTESLDNGNAAKKDTAKNLSTSSEIKNAQLVSASDLITGEKSVLGNEVAQPVKPITDNQGGLKKMQTSTALLNTAEADLLESTTSEKVLSESITTEKVLSESTTSEKVLSESTTSEKVLSESITTEKVPSEKITSEKVLSETVNSANTAISKEQELVETKAKEADQTTALATKSSKKMADEQASNENKIAPSLNANTNEKAVESSSSANDVMVNSTANSTPNVNEQSAAKSGDNSALARQQNNVSGTPTTVAAPLQDGSAPILEQSKLANKTNADNVDEIQVIAKDAQQIERDKVASMVNQTLDAQAARSGTSSINEPVAQQIQSFDNIINKMSADSVQTQKSATVLQNETISIYRKDFADAVKDKVMVMINQKIQQVDIQLDPPEMGNVQVRVNLQNEQAVVHFVVQNQQAKEALDQNINKLKEMLAENGVDVGDANIEQREPQSNEQQNMTSDQQQAGNEQDASMTQSDNHMVNMVKASSTGVDYYA
jgi:flagellar hook-length control protein FliK